MSDILPAGTLGPGVRRLVICTNIHCLMNGSEELIEHLLVNHGAAPGFESENGLVVEEACCFAACELGPNVDVDGIIYDGMTPERLDDLIVGVPQGFTEKGARFAGGKNG